MRVTCWGFMLLCLLPAGVLAGLDHSVAAEDQQEPVGQSQRAFELVRQLGANRFAERERASGELIALGEPAIEALKQGLQHKDREIRLRSGRILAVVRQQELERRLDAFAVDRDRERDYHLPGWGSFRQLVGDDGDIRALFVEMFRRERELMDSVDQGSEAVENALQSRLQQLKDPTLLGREQRDPDLASVAAFLFAATQQNVTLTGTMAPELYSYTRREVFDSAVREGAHKPILRKMLGQFVRASDGASVYYALLLSLQHELPEGLAAAERVLSNPNPLKLPNESHLRHYSALVIARFGDRAHVPLLEPLLDDSSPFGGVRQVRNAQYPTQIRDTALAVLLRLTNQNYQDYGFKWIQLQPITVFDAGSLAFENDDQREAAIGKWRAYQGGLNPDE